MRARFLLAVPALALAAMAAVSPSAPAWAQQGFSFAEKGVITLDVASIEVVTEYRPPLKAPHVDHAIAVTPSDAVRLWAADRLKAGGGSGVARVVVKDASVKEQTLPRTDGVKGWFTKDQSEKYEARMEVEVQVTKPNGFSGQTTAVVARSTTVDEDVSVAEREKVLMDLVRSLARDLDAQLEPAIKTTLFPVVIL